MKYVVQFTLPYVQRVMVGIEAASSDEAIKKAEALSRPRRHHAGQRGGAAAIR